MYLLNGLTVTALYKNALLPLHAFTICSQAANVIKAFDRCLDSVASRHNVIQKKDGYTVTVASGN